MPNKPLTANQHEKDSMVMGGIIAGAHVSKKKVAIGISSPETRTNLCAIGVANRGLKIKNANLGRFPDNIRIPVERFAKAYNVSINYAWGVNDGFEGTRISGSITINIKTDSLDYQRGYHVGQTASIEFCSDPLGLQLEKESQV